MHYRTHTTPYYGCIRQNKSDKFTFYKLIYIIPCNLKNDYEE